MEQGLLMIMAAPELEELLIDCLLEHPGIGGFTSAEVHGHSTRSMGMSLAEQVKGQRRRVQFTLRAPLPVIQDLLGHLRERFQNAGLHYILLPVLESGPI